MIYLAIVILGTMGILETILRFLLITLFCLFTVFMGLGWIKPEMFDSKCFNIADKLVNKVMAPLDS